MTHYRRCPSGLLVSDHEVRGFRGSRVGGFSGIARGSSAGATVAALPVLTAIDPSTGDTAGGGTLTGWGTSFRSGDALRIDEVDQSTTFVSSGELTCTIPAHAAGSVNVVVRRGVTDSNALTFEFTAGGGANLVFASAWDYATGTSVAAVGDNNIWPAVNNGSSKLEVVSASGLFGAGFTNCLRVGLDDVAIDDAWVSLTGLTAPSVGGSRWFRFYMHSAIADTEETFSLGGHHPVEWNKDTTHGEDLLAFKWGHTNGSGVMSNQLLVFGATWPDTYWNTHGNLNYNTTYRMEFQLKRPAANQLELHARVYDDSDALLYGDAAWDNNNDSKTFVDNVTLTGIDDDGWGAFHLGMNGRVGDGSDVVAGFHYLGGVAISESDWCGPYSVGEGP